MTINLVTELTIDNLLLLISKLDREELFQFELGYEKLKQFRIQAVNEIQQDYTHLRTFVSPKQNPSMVAKIESNKLHPVMSAFGLWQNEKELDSLTDEIYTNRQSQFIGAIP